jgi:FixJ family two-component response regulator
MSHATSIVFVVDDDISVRESLELLIDSAGWQAKTFASAREFLAYPRAPCAPSCLVLDVNTPDLDGLELQARIALGRIDMPIILISGYDDVPTFRTVNAGAVSFLTKPLDAAALLRAIQHGIDANRAALGRDAHLGAPGS